MARSVILGNGSLTVGLTQKGHVHDFYYPYVGLDNLSTSRGSRHKIGIWVDGEFSWLDTADWQEIVSLEPDALVANVQFIHDRLQLEIRTADFVDYNSNAFCRQFTVHNRSDKERTVRLFLHQAFEISRAGRADTALYVPYDNSHYMLDYKGRCSLLIYSELADGTPFDQWAVGNYAIEGKEGTWRDAEDGELSGNTVEHGGVDSVIRNTLTLSGQSSEVVNYWIIATDSQFSAEIHHDRLRKDGLQKRLAQSRKAWGEWLHTAKPALDTMNDTEATAVKKSLMTIKAHTDKRGGIIASCDSSIYNFGRDYYSYVWPRDGAYVIWPLIRLGYTEEPKKFFEFCRDIMHKNGYMMHKYQPDKAIGSTWHPYVHGSRIELAIQEDETAIVVFMLAEYYRESQDREFVESLYLTMIKPMANFMASYIDEETGLPHASYDLWEEKFLTNTYTTAITIAALQEAAHFAEEFEYPDDAVAWHQAADNISKNLAVFYDPERELLRKGFLLQDDGSLHFDSILDVSSAYGAMMYAGRAFGAHAIKSSFEAIEKILLPNCPSGGAARYETDYYFRVSDKYYGNPWFVTTLWVAQYYLQTQQKEKAEEFVQWTIQHALPSGILSEQIHPETGEPISVTPLVWSHAELINILLDLRSVD